MKKRQYSLRTLFAFIGLVLILTVLVTALVNTAVTAGIIRRQTLEIMDRSAGIQAQRLADQLDAMASQLVRYTYDNKDVTVLETSAPYSGEWFTALRDLQDDFDTARSAGLADCYFLYLPNSDILYGGTVTFTEAQAAALREAAAGADPRYRWQTVAVGEDNYLTCLLRVQNGCVGAWVRVDRALREAGNGEQGVLLDIADADGTLLGSTGLGSIADTPENSAVTLAGERYLMITDPVDQNFSLVTLASYNSVWSQVWRYLLVALPIVLGVMLVFLLVNRGAQRGILRPVQDLTEAIRELRSGDAQARVEADSTCRELGELGTAFNDMVKEIADLRIGVYEEQLRRQDIEIEYLKMQVTPHFLVNCLNTVYQLTEAGQPELTMRMVRGLNSHIRYMLGAEVMVPMSQELDLVRNYIDLSSIRYPGCLELVTDYDPETLDATAIPLLVLNFVENTVKYEAGVGKPLEIHVSTRVDRSGEAPRVKINIWDTGRGFSPEMLEALQDLPSFVAENRRKHIGISNVFLRAELVMGECGFAFSNRPGAGAQIDIDMAYVPYYRKGEKKDDTAHR